MSTVETPNGTKPSAATQAHTDEEIVKALDGVAWMGKSLVVHDREKVEGNRDKGIRAIRRKNLSASTSKSVSGCAARFAIESMLPRTVNPLGAAELGTVAHEVLEHFYEREPGKRTLTNLRKGVTPAVRNGLAAFEGTPQYDDLFAEVKKTIAPWVENIFDLENPSEVNVFRTEMEFKDIPLSNGVPFVGYLDRTRIDGDPSDLENATLHIDDYKGLALTTPVPTPTGWTTVGELKVGDLVFSPSGATATVTFKSDVHNRPCYELTFSDGSQVVSDHVHDWVVRISGQGRTEVRQIEAQHLHTLAKSLESEGRTGALSVDNTYSVLESDDTDLPVDPYLLGAWLGDGRGRSGEICTGLADRDEMEALFRAHWAGNLATHTQKSNDEVVGYVFSFGRSDNDKCRWGHDKTSRLDGSERKGATNNCLACMKLDRAGTARPAATNITLAHVLREEGLLNNKHIPSSYLRASAEQRRQLVRGLMDTDGSWHAGRNRAVFVNTNKDIADGMYELLVSLGVTVSRFTNMNTGGHPAYVLEFSPLVFNPFAMPRKARGAEAFRLSFAHTQKNGAPARAYRRTLVSIREVPSVPTQCIKVDDPSEMFLCGEGFVPTHNTGKKVKYPSPMFGDDYGDQMRIYDDAIEQTFGKPAGSATLIWPRQKKLVHADLSKPAKRATLAAFSRSWDLMNATADAAVFPAVPSNLCGWCPAANSCPVANVKSANAVANARKMHGGPEGPVALGIPTVREFTAPPRMNEGAGDVPDTETTEENTVTITDGSGKLAFPNNKWAAMATVSLTDAAATHLDIYGQPLKPATIQGLAHVLGGIAEEVHREVFMGGFDWSFDSASRVVHSLNASLRSRPAPFGQDAAAWEKWRKTLIGLTSAKLRIAVPLVEINGFGPANFDALLVNTVLPEQKNHAEADAEADAEVQAEPVPA